MSLTPLDIHHKEFAHALRGYDVAEVDAFLEEVKIELEKAQRMAAELAKRTEVAEQKLAKYVTMEGSINNAFISAQQSADSIKSTAQSESQSLLEAARSEGERVYREAESKAREIIREALAERERIAGEADRLQRSEDEFRRSYISLLDHFYAEAKKKEFAPEPIVETVPEPAAVEEAFEEPNMVAEAPAEEPVVPIAAGMPEPTVEEPVADEAPVIDPFAPQTVPPTPAPVVPVSEPVVVAAAPAFVAPEPVAEKGYGYSDLGEVEDDFEIEEID